MPKRTYRSAFKSRGFRGRTKRFKRGTRGFTRVSGNYGRYRWGFKRGMGALSRPELKFWDTETQAEQLGGPGSGIVLIPSLNELVQGTGNSQLIGRKAVIKSITMKGTMELLYKSAATYSVEAGDSYRLVLVLDRQANGAAPLWTDVFVDASVESMIRLENSMRFTIIKEWIGSMNTMYTYNTTLNTFVAPGVLKTWKWSKKCNIPLEFVDGASGDIADVKSNNLVLMGISVVSNMYFTSNFRIRFADN